MKYKVVVAITKPKVFNIKKIIPEETLPTIEEKEDKDS